MTLLTERQEVLLAQLAELATNGFEKAKEEWEKSVLAWGTLPSSLPNVFLPRAYTYLAIDKRQEKIRQEAADAGANGSASGSAAPTRHPTEEMDVDGHPPLTQAEGGDGAKDKNGKDKEPHSQHPPSKRYRMTDEMKAIIWELVLLSNECCRLENEKKWVLQSFIF